MGSGYVLSAGWAARSAATKESPSALTTLQCGCRYSVARIAFRHDWLRDIGTKPSQSYSWLTETTENLAERHDSDVKTMWDFAVVSQILTSSPLNPNRHLRGCVQTFQEALHVAALRMLVCVSMHLQKCVSVSVHMHYEQAWQHRFTTSTS